MSIDTNGKITYSPTQILPETNFIVTCTSKTSAATTQLTSKIEVTPADVGGVVINNIGTFDLVLGENKSSLVTCTATVNPNPGTIQAVTWSIVDRPTWATINPTTGVVSINDATHTALVDNQQTITVRAESNQDATKFATEEFYINFTQPQPPSTDSFSWWWLLAVEAGALVLGSVISIIVIVKRKQEIK